MKEIKIVFHPHRPYDPDSKDAYEGWYDLYFDGVKQERVKRFAIDLPAIVGGDVPNDLCYDYSYTLEHYVNLEEVVPEEWLG